MLVSFAVEGKRRKEKRKRERGPLASRQHQVTVDTPKYSLNDDPTGGSSVDLSPDQTEAH